MSHPTSKNAHVHIGEERGIEIGEKIGLIAGKLEATTRFFQEGRISEQEYRALEKQLREELEKARVEKG